MDNIEGIINLDNLPNHIAIIMDGNRRWAKQNKLTTPEGHKEGAENLKRICKFANKIGIKYMSVYAFSTENWKRSKEEISAIMKILKSYISKFFESYNEDIRIKVLGRRNDLPKDLQEEIIKIEDKTKNNKGLTLNICFNYGGRDDIVNATKKIAANIEKGIIKVDDINEEMISNNLYSVGSPDPDLVIRTSGEERISNFLTWQIAYSEFVFVKKYWPEYNEEDLIDSIKTYQNRTRRFGGK